MTQTAGQNQATMAAPVNLVAPLLMADISDPGTTVIPPSPAGLEAFAFYAGGNTPHVWTAAQIARQQLRFAVPVWVYGPGASGTADGQDAAAALRALGIPAGTAVRLDMETGVDTGYCRQFRAAVDAAGYWFGPYGSASSVFGNPHGGAGWWVADWTGHPHEYPHDHVWGTQYADAAQAGLPWDLSELSSLAHCWDRSPPTWTAAAASSARAIAAEAADLATIITANA